MLIFYSALFFGGLIFTLISALLGSLLDLDGFELEFDGDFDVPNIFLAPLKPIVILPFITAFGGVGWYMTSAGFGPITTAGASLLNAFAIGAIMYNFVFKKLKKLENTSASTREEFIGRDARVSETILENSFGSISYESRGNLHRSPAKSVDGKRIPAGTTVVICYMEGGTYFVERLDDELSDGE